ncbi:MAG: hypothetical protein JW894_02310 [Bacteroidales bacterium]|nr:hypothetical protein [Bacteroidales bacterium]
MQNYESKLVESSKKLSDIMISDIGDDPERFLEMYRLAVRDEYPLSMRAGGIIAKIANKHVCTVQKLIPEIIEILPSIKVEGVKRGFLKMLIELPLEIDEDLSGQLADLAFEWISDSKQAIAIRAYSMDIIYNFSLKYHEIVPEFIAVLDEVGRNGSAGLKQRCRKMIDQLKMKLPDY